MGAALKRNVNNAVFALTLTLFGAGALLVLLTVLKAMFTISVIVGVLASCPVAVFVILWAKLIVLAAEGKV